MLSAAAAAAVAFSLVLPVAQADDAVDPDPAATAEAPAPSEAPGGTLPVAGASGAPQEPSRPRSAAPRREPATTTAPGPAGRETGRTAGPPPATEPEPGTDGVLPAYGVDDAYWNAFRVLQQRQGAVVAAERDLAAARDVLEAANTRSAQLRAISDAAAAEVAASRVAVDRLASQLYQYGSPVTAVTAMLGAPETFLRQVDTANNQDVAARLLVDRAAADASSAAAAWAAAQVAADQAEVAARGVAAAERARRAARAALRAASSELTGLVGTAPQTAIGPDGCPAEDVAGTLRGGAEQIGARRLCRAAVAGAATPQAALAITWAFAHLGAAYACGGAGRMLPWRMDCSSLVSRAYHEGAGLAVAGAGWAPSTREMVPWGGASLDPHYALVRPAALRPGDLVLYDTGGAAYRHVVIYLGPVKPGGTSWMLHTNSCGDVAKVEPFWGFPTSGSATFLVARRVLRLPSDPPVRG